MQPMASNDVKYIWVESATKGDRTLSWWTDGQTEANYTLTTNGQIVARGDAAHRLFAQTEAPNRANEENAP